MTLAHFLVDFYGGLCVPLVEPTLMEHLGASLSSVMLVVVSTAIFINAVVQPLAGILLPKRDIPQILIVAVLMAALTALIGLTSNYYFFWILMLFGGVGIGVLHPEGAIMVQSLGRRQLGLATSFFMSAGFLGFSFGALVGGWWGQNYALRGLWLLSFPAIIVAYLIVIASLHRYHCQGSQNVNLSTKTKIPFFPVWAVATLIATTLVILFRLLPIYIVREFGRNAQSWGGTVLFTLGLSGAFGAYFWGHLSDRYGCGRMVALAYFLSAPFLYLLLHTKDFIMISIWGALAGVTLGAVFPLPVVLAKKASFGSYRLRMGLCIGGAWGVAELFTLLVTVYYIDLFPKGDVEPVFHLLNGCFVIIALVIAFGLWLGLSEKKSRVCSG